MEIFHRVLRYKHFSKQQTPMQNYLSLIFFSLQLDMCHMMQAPNYHQNLVSAQMGDDGDDSVLVPNYFLERLGYNGSNANSSNFGFWGWFRRSWRCNGSNFALRGLLQFIFLFLHLFSDIWCSCWTNVNCFQIWYDDLWRLFNF